MLPGKCEIKTTRCHQNNKRDHDPAHRRHHTLGRTWGHRTLSTAGGDANGVATLEDGLVPPYRMNTLLPYDPAFGLPSLYPKEMKIMSTS